MIFYAAIIVTVYRIWVVLPAVLVVPTLNETLNAFVDLRGVVSVKGAANSQRYIYSFSIGARTLW